MENITKAKSLLQKKENGLKEILSLTLSYKIGDTDGHALNYIDLMNKRESIITDLKHIDLELSHKKYGDVLNDNSILEIRNNIKKLCENIVDRDRLINKNADILLHKFKSRAKEYVTGKNLSNAYSIPIDENYSFDINN